MTERGSVLIILSGHVPILRIPVLSLNYENQLDLLNFNNLTIQAIRSDVLNVKNQGWGWIAHWIVKILTIQKDTFGRFDCEKPRFGQPRALDR